MARIEFEPVEGAARYVVVPPWIDEDVPCVEGEEPGQCVAAFDEVVAGDCGFVLVAVVGDDRRPSDSFCIDRIASSVL